MSINNISALSQTNYRYWVSFRTKYLSSDNLNLIGSVDIKLMKFPTKKLFEPLAVNRVKITIPYSDYHDWTGFNSLSANKNYDTMVNSA